MKSPSIRANLHYGQGPRAMTMKIVRALETHPKVIPLEVDIETFAVTGLPVLCKDIHNWALNLSKPSK